MFFLLLRQICFCKFVDYFHKDVGEGLFYIAETLHSLKNYIQKVTAQNLLRFSCGRMSDQSVPFSNLLQINVITSPSPFALRYKLSFVFIWFALYVKMYVF
jgi:hypothetical protein